MEWNQKNQFGIQLDKRIRGKWSSDWNKFVTSPLSKKIVDKNFIKDDVGELVFKTTNLNGQIGGESNACVNLNSFLKERHKGYSKKMSSPLTAENSCSRLSPHISFGTISIRSIVHRVEKYIDKKKIEKTSIYSFKKRLAWHCHFIQKLYDQPDIESENLHPLYNGLRENSFNFDYYESWKKGKTGFPFLDACMRFLNTKGWLNFRMRAMIMSFASYNLWQPWQKTSPRLAELFVDYEPGIHICQVQMQSGVTGINLPRIYSVLKQSSDQDPTAMWIKDQINSLKNIEPKNIHEAELNEIYHEKIVDLKASAKKARETIWSVRKGSDFKKIAKDVYLKHGSRLRRA